MRIAISLLLAFTVVTTASAQVFFENFNYPDGPVPGWTTATGTWSIKNGRLTATGSGWRYINSSMSAKDCVMDGEFFLVTSTLQFGGLTARHPGGTSSTNLMMCKIQNNSSPGPATAFNRCYIYEQPGSSVYQDVPNPRPTQAFCRMIILDSNCWMLVDTDQDGFYEMTVGPRVITSVNGSGLCGMNSYGPCEMDNFEFFNGVIYDAPTSPAPQPGASLEFVLRGSPGLQYQAASSFGNSGIPIGGGRVVPLTPDPLFLLSASNIAPAIFDSYAGLLNAAGDGGIKIHLPNSAGIVGLPIITAIVTFNTSGVSEVSNDHQVRIIP